MPGSAAGFRPAMGTTGFVSSGGGVTARRAFALSNVYSDFVAAPASKTYTTGTITPTFTGEVLVVTFYQSQTGVWELPTVGGTLGGSVTLQRSQQASASFEGLRVYTVTGYNTSGTMSFTIVTNQLNRAEFVVDEVDGANLATPVVQSTSVNNTDLSSPWVSSMTLAALGAAANASYGSYGNTNEALTMTLGSGYTGLKSPTANRRLFTEYKAPGSTTVDCSANGNVEFMGVSLEIAKAT